MQVSIIDIEKKKTGEAEVPKQLFETPWKPELVHQAIVAQQANNRQKTAKVKNRGEVRGGGKKPWKQKGTGRARHGSIRSPLWIGGGVTHGPTAERNFSVKINKKMKTVALFSLLSKRFAEGKVFVMEGIGGEAYKKTKELAKHAAKIKELGKTVLIVTPSSEKNVFIGSRNMHAVSCISAKSLNIVDIAKPSAVIISSQALPEIVHHYITKEKPAEK